MPDTREAERGPVHEARSAFEKLNTQDKVTFAVEAAFAAVGQALGDAGRHLAGLFEEVAAEADRFGRRRAAGSGPEPEQPPRETAAEAPPRPGRRRG